MTITKNKLIFIAKPQLNNDRYSREFDNPRDAVDYLNSLLPDDYPCLYVEDAYLIGKLYEKSGDTSWVPSLNKKKAGRPKKNQ